MAAALTLLQSFLGDPLKKTLLVIDENFTGEELCRLPAHTQVIGNRIDLVRQAQSAGLAAYFNDFDLSPFAEASLDLICLPLSKEKAVNCHVAEQAFSRLRSGGSLVLTGNKQSGIKNFAKTVGARFGVSVAARKQGSLYIADILRTEKATDSMLVDGAPVQLEDQDYNRLRPIFTFDNRPVLSKPGLFGWQKRDRGSELLVRLLPGFLQRLGRKPGSMLDLGCGYGYLSIMAAKTGLTRIVATDNCAAAITACRANFSTFAIEGEVIADDAGSTIGERFETVLCNPPFHQGFAQDYRLTDRFLASARKLLRSGGRALFVVNEFVPLEQRAGRQFNSVSTWVRESGFKVVELA